jgi:tripartite-type tricarboxylate transporter receptor subunit TctC
MNRPGSDPHSPAPPASPSGGAAARRRRLLAAGVGLAAVVAMPRLARAQGDRVPKLILPVSAGSGVDTIVRASAPTLGKVLGQSVVVDNQPGAGGVVGTQAMIKSAPDGQTLAIVSNNHVVYPSVIKALGFDPIADITPIAALGATPFALITNPSLSAATLRDFIALLKASPGRYNYASSGNGTILHLAAELFKEAAQVFSTHIPYRGFSQMLNDIMGGQVDWGVGAVPAVQGSVRTGRLRALCVPSAARSQGLAEVPTAAEAGLPAFQVEGWFAAVGPKGMAPDVVRRLHAAFSATFQDAGVLEAMSKQGNVIRVRSPEETLAFFRSELDRYARTVRRAGVVAQ